MKNICLIIASLSFLVASIWADSPCGTEQIVADETLRMAFWSAAGNNNNCSKLVEIFDNNHIADGKTLTKLVGDAKDYNTCVKSLSTLIGDEPDESTINKYKAHLALVKLV